MCPEHRLPDVREFVPAVHQNPNKKDTIDDKISVPEKAALP
jgi:hypothetical protein